MSEVVVLGGQCKCIFGKLPATLIFLPTSMVFIDGRPVGDIFQFAPFLNITTFGMCQAPTNPLVIAAGGAPVPCTPIIVSPWIPTKPNILAKMKPILLKNSMTFCAYAGLITISNPGQFKVRA